MTEDSAKSDDPHGSDGYRRPLRLLIVEDDAAAAELVISHLQQQEYQVEAERVETREALRQALTQQSWDAVISDHRLPRLSGREALDEFHQTGLDIPFIVLSEMSGEETAIEYIKAGANDYLIKENVDKLAPALRRELREANDRRLRRETERAHRESLSRYKQVVEAAGEGVFILDTRARLNLANRRLLEILARDLERVMAHSIFEFLHPEDTARVRSRWRRPKGAELLEIRLQRGEGETVWTQVSLSALRDERGKWTGTVGMVTDITERKRLQEQILTAEVEKKRFSRQVLRAVTKGKLHVVDPGELPNEGQLTVEIPLDGQPGYRQLLETLRQTGPAQGLSAEASYDFTLAVGEAATNVLKHACDGRAEIRVVEDRLIARVSDRGPGIKAENLPSSLLEAGFSTAVSLGLGYTLMLEMSDSVWLASGPEGTIVQLEKYFQTREPQFAAMDRF